MILKYLKEVVFNDKNGIGSGSTGSNTETGETGEVTTARRNEILTGVANQFEIKLDELEKLGEDN